MSQHISCIVNGKKRYFLLNTQLTMVRFFNLLELHDAQPVVVTNLQFLHQPSDLPAVAEILPIESN